VEITCRKKWAPKPDLKKINHDNMEARELYQALTLDTKTSSGKPRNRNAFETTDDDFPK